MKGTTAGVQRPGNEDAQPGGNGEGLEEETEEATVWAGGLDKLNNSNPEGPKAPGISLCVDLSATPFYHRRQRPSRGPAVPVDRERLRPGGCHRERHREDSAPAGAGHDRAARSEVFQAVEGDQREPGARRTAARQGERPKPEVVYREAEGALQQIAGQWKERFDTDQRATPGQERVPPVLILVCDNTDIAEVFYRKISGETEAETVTEADVEEVLEEDDGEERAGNERQAASQEGKDDHGLWEGRDLPGAFSNTPDVKRTIRIDTKLLAEAESDDPKKEAEDAAEELRQVVATVGKPGQPGEHVRCVVSVSMLTEGWDANNVTHILGVRAFGSQLLCEQVVGRGLRRMDYTPSNRRREALTEEYVDVYGIPFSVIPFKGRVVTASATEDKPKKHVMALPERKAMEIRFPVVEGYAFALRKNLIKCDVASMESLVIEPHKEPTATFLTATVGYKEGHAASGSLILPLVEQDRHTYYEQNHIETIKFNLARIVVESLSEASHQGTNRNARVFRLQSKHQLFPQVFSVVDEYVRTKVNFQNENPSELGLEIYVQRIIERLLARIEPDDENGEMPLMPLLNRYKPIGSTAEVEFKTTKPCFATAMSHINQVVADTQQWEQTAAFRLEMAAKNGLVLFYAKNDHLDLLIPYEYFGGEHNYIPDYLVRMANGVTLLLEIKGQEDNQDKAKHDSARRWISAVNNWGKLGKWDLHVCRNPQILERELQYVLSSREK